MATSLPWRTSLSSKSQTLHFPHTHLSTRHSTSLHASLRSNFDEFSNRFHSGELWRDFWRTASEGFEQFVFETQRVSVRIERKFEVSRRFADVAESAILRAKMIDSVLRIREKWRNFLFDFGIFWPLYRERITDFFNGTVGQSTVMFFFLWSLLSGWWRFVVISICLTAFFGPILVEAFAKILAARVKSGCK